VCQPPIEAHKRLRIRLRQGIGEDAEHQVRAAEGQGANRVDVVEDLLVVEPER
jgi:hypothetical protein